MTSNPFSNFNYRDLDTTIDGVHEICVTYQYNGKNLKRIVFIKNKKGINYINQAKKIIDQDIHNGKLLKYSKKMSGLKVSAHPGLKIALAISAVAAVGMGGAFTYLYLNSQGGDTPTKEETVKVGLTTEAKSQIEIDKSEAIIGKEFEATITVKEDDMQIILMNIKSDEQSLKEGSDFTLTPINTNAKLSYALLIYPKAIKGIIEIAKIDLAPAKEKWNDIPKERAIGIADDLYNRSSENEGVLTSLLRIKDKHGVYKANIKGTSGGTEMLDEDKNLYFDLRNVNPDPIDKDVYLKREEINNLTKKHSEYYYVFLPNTKKTEISENGIYKFESAGSKDPTSNTHLACRETDIEKTMNSDFVFFDLPGLMLEGANGDFGLLTSIAILSDPSSNPEINEYSFKSQNKNSLLGSISGSYDTEIEGTISRISFTIEHLRIEECIVTDAKGSLVINRGGQQMQMDITCKLEYKEIQNEYNPSWPISE